MKSITELEREIEKHIIETLSSYRQIKVVLENTDYTPEQKIKLALSHINNLKKIRKNKFKLDNDYAAEDLVLDGEYEFTENLELLKLRILHKIMNNTSSYLISSDDNSLFDNV
jgi:ferritin-like metal-binding protein YciE